MSIQDPFDQDPEIRLPAIPRAPLRRRLRAYLLTGVVIAAPLAITAYLSIWFINFIGRRMEPLVKPFLPESNGFVIAIVGVLVMLALLTLLGFLTTNFAGRSVVAYGESLVARVPIVRTLYNALKHIFETVIHQSENSFQHVGLIEFPRPGTYAVVFIARETKGEISERTNKEDMVTVFVPKVPNPTNGFLLFLPRKDVIILEMTVEEAAKLLISAGLITPERRSQAPPEGLLNDSDRG